MHKYPALVVFVLAVLLGFTTTGSTPAKVSDRPTLVDSAPVWVPVPYESLSAGCQSATAFTPIVFWPGENTTYILRTMAHGYGSVGLRIAGQEGDSAVINSGSVWVPITLTAHFQAPPDTPVQISITLQGPDNCPDVAYIDQPNVFIAP